MRRYHQAHNLFEPYAGRRQVNTACQYIRLTNGQITLCGQPTGGKVYCAGCEDRRLSSHSGSKFHSVRSVRSNG